MREFNAAPRRVRAGWDAAKVARVWLGWTHAKSALLGHRTPKTKIEQRREQQTDRRQEVLEQQLAGLQAWLATNPRATTRTTYDTWRDRENRRRGEDDPSFVRSATLIGNFAVPFDRLVELARREPDESEEQDAASEEVVPGIGTDRRVADGSTLAANLKAARLARGMSRTELTVRAGLAEGHVTRMEQGRIQAPVFPSMVKIAVALSVPLDYFVTPNAKVPGASPAARGKRTKKR